MIIREAQAADMAALAQVFYRAVHLGAADAYSEAQRRAWVAQQPTAAAWAQRLDGLLTLVAQVGDAPVGFISARLEDGYLDLAFVQPERRGQGVMAAIYAVLENRMRTAKVARLHTQASHPARSFFERAGWITLGPNRVERGDQTLDNWIMEKTLDLGEQAPLK